MPKWKKTPAKIRISKEDITKSYQEGHYVEAIVLTHVIIETYMNLTFDTVAALMNPLAPLNKLMKKKNLYPVSNYGFSTIMNILFDMGVYNKKLYDSLLKFNRCRNTIIHRLFVDIPTKPEIDDCFELGMKLWDNTWKILQQHQQKSFERLKSVLETKPS